MSRTTMRRKAPKATAPRISRDARAIVSAIEVLQASLSPRTVTVNNAVTSGGGGGSTHKASVAPRFSPVLHESADSRPILVDRKTGLQWTAEPIGEFSYKKAIEACEKLVVAGGGWRLPSIEELGGIRDRSRFRPAFPPEFKLPEYGWLWSSTKAASDPESFAWYVSLDLGSSSVLPRSLEGLVLAVRGPAASPGQVLSL